MLDFKSIFTQNYWVDWKLSETLIRILEPLWAELVFSQAGVSGSTTEMQKIEKKISNLMDINVSEELNKLLDVIFNHFIISKLDIISRSRRASKGDISKSHN